MTRTKRDSLYEVNDAPPTLAQRLRRPAIVAGAVAAGPIAGVVAVGTGRLMFWLAGSALEFPSTLAMVGCLAAVIVWFVACDTATRMLDR